MGQHVGLPRPDVEAGEAGIEGVSNSAQVGTGFKKVCGEAVAQRVGMDAPVVEASAFGCDLTCTR